MSKTMIAGLSAFRITMYGPTIILTICSWLLSIGPAFAEITQDKARVYAANHGRKCSVDMADGQVKCQGRPLRTLAEAKELLSDGKLVSDGTISDCNINKTVWVFEWRAFPKQTPILVDAKTGRLVSCRP